MNIDFLPAAEMRAFVEKEVEDYTDMAGKTASGGKPPGSGRPLKALARAIRELARHPHPRPLPHEGEGGLWFPRPSPCLSPQGRGEEVRGI